MGLSMLDIYHTTHRLDSNFRDDLTDIPSEAGSESDEALNLPHTTHLPDLDSNIWDYLPDLVSESESESDEAEVPTIPLPPPTPLPPPGHWFLSMLIWHRLMRSTHGNGMATLALHRTLSSCGRKPAVVTLFCEFSAPSPALPLSPPPTSEAPPPTPDTYSPPSWPTRILPPLNHWFLSMLIWHRLMRSIHGNGKQSSQRMFNIDAILDSRGSLASNDRAYLVKWKGYADKHNTWEPHSVLAHLGDLLDSPRASNTGSALTTLTPRTQRNNRCNNRDWRSRNDHTTPHTAEDSPQHTPTKNSTPPGSSATPVPGPVYTPLTPARPAQAPECEGSATPHNTHTLAPRPASSPPTPSLPSSPAIATTARTRADIASLIASAAHVVALRETHSHSVTPAPSSRISPPSDGPRRFDSIPTEEQLWSVLLPEAIKLHLKAMPLGAIGPAQSWTPSLTSAWKTALFNFHPQWKAALDTWDNDKNPLPLLNVFLIRQSLPAAVLIGAAGLTPTTGTHLIDYPTSDFVALPDNTFTIDLGESDRTPRATYDHLWSHPDPTPITAEADKTVRRCISNYSNQRTKAAARSLISNGTAPRCQAVNKILGSMHPAAKKPIVPPPLPLHTGEPLEITPAECADRIRYSSCATQAPRGFFGWRDDMLHPVCGRKLKGKRAFLNTDARFTALIATGNLPKSVAFLLTCGSLSAFHKRGVEEQQQREAEGLPMQIRPVCNGPAATKQGLRMLNNSDPAKKMRKSLGPIQMGCGVPAGPEVVAHTSRALYNKGYIGLTTDAINGFNELDREDMLHKVSKKFPQATQTMNCFYGFISPVIYTWVDEEGVARVSVHLSQRGPRMGCVMGSPGYDIALDPVYSALDHEFPTVELQALTDDLPAWFPPPDLDKGETWDDAFAIVQRFVARYNELANPLGIFLGPDKMKLILPPGAPAPPVPNQGGIHNLDLHHTWEGAMIGGAPIGSPVFVSKVVTEKLKLAQHRIEAVVRLSKFDSQLAVTLLGLSANAALDYVVKIAPPTLIAEHIATFDDAIDKALLDCLTPSTTAMVGATAPPSDLRRKMSAIIRQIATKNGGFGQVKLVYKAHAAYLASVAHMADHEHLRPLGPYLLPHIESSREAFMQLLEIDESNLDPRSPIGSALRSKAEYLICPPSNPRSPTQTPKRRNDMGIFLKSINQHLIRTLQRPLTAQQGTQAQRLDAHNALAAISRSQSTRVLTSQLWLSANRIDTLLFTCWARSHLGLPPMGKWTEAIMAPGWDIPLERCGRRHINTMGNPVDKFIDPYGSHAAGCLSSNLAYCRMHTVICNIFKLFGLEAGWEVSREPDTATVFNNNFTKEALRGMFPARPTTRENVIAGAVRTIATDHLSVVQDEVQRAHWIAVSDVLSNQLDESRTGHNGENKSIRLDLHMISPEGALNYYVDCTTANCTTASYVTSSLKWFTAHAKAALLTSETGAPNPFHRQSSKRVEQAQKDKHTKYQHFMTVATNLFQKRKLGCTQMPVFLAPTFAHHGELSLQGMTACHQRRSQLTSACVLKTH